MAEAIKIFDMRDHAAENWALNNAVLLPQENGNLVFENNGSSSDFVYAGGRTLEEQSGLDLSDAKITVKFEIVPAGCKGPCRYYGVGHKSIGTSDATGGYKREVTYDEAGLAKSKTNYLKIYRYGGRIEIKTWEVWAEIPIRIPKTLLGATTDAVMADIKANPNREELIYKTQDHVNKIYVRNPNRLLADVDLTCVSPWNSREKHRRAGTAFTPRHIWNAWHYRLFPGDTIRFVTLDNQIVERKIVAHYQYGEGQDLCISTLDADLPPSIRPAQICDQYMWDFCPREALPAISVFSTDQEEKLFIKTPMYTSPRSSMWFSSSNVPEFKPFTEALVGGDSGGPIFAIIGGRVVGLSSWDSIATGTGIHPHITFKPSTGIPSIKELVEQTGHKLDILDLNYFISEEKPDA